jgi:hypothetical protein
MQNALSSILANSLPDKTHFKVYYNFCWLALGVAQGFEVLCSSFLYKTKINITYYQ